MKEMKTTKIKKEDRWAVPERSVGEIKLGYNT